ncbi:hypothetical protein R50072_02890 [Simiduia litorea]|uniref:hypothetical protein n=1 Tax=Simiduia litorea TaxID=1435348 RepID=UPI0036F1C8D1
MIAGKYFNICMAALLLIFTLPAQAHDGNKGWVTATGYYLWTNTYGEPQIRVQTQDGYYNPAETCTELDSYMVDTRLSSEVQSRIYSVLLAASLASKPVRLYISIDSCERGGPMIQVVVIS